MSLVKDSSILELLNRIDLDSRNWTVIDYWDADLCAVGIAHKDHPRHLVYISTFGEARNHYYYECEEPSGPELTDYSAVDSGENVSCEHLLRVLEHHLSVRPSISRP